MKPSSAPKGISPAKARNTALLNLLATPGLGSLMAGRWLAGTGQLILALAGFLLVVVWFVKIMVPYYGMMFSDTPPPPINGKVAEAGAALFALAWCWSLVTSISVYSAASKVSVDTLKLFGAGLTKMDDPKIAAALNTVPTWQQAGQVIARTYEFADFPAAMNFVNAVAGLAEQAQHHPDIDVRWNKVTLAFTTHDSGGLTEKDFSMARLCDTQASRQDGTQPPILGDRR